MDDSRKINVLITFLAVVIVLLLFQNYNYGREFKSLKSQVASLQNDLYNNSNQVYNNIVNHLDSTIKQAQSLVEDYSINYDGIDLDSKTVNLHMGFRLKETSADSEVQVYALPTNEAAIDNNHFKAVTSNGVDYTCDFAISYGSDYTFDIYETNDVGYRKKLNTESISKSIKSDFENRTFVPSAGVGIDEKGVHMDFEVENKTFGQEAFKIKKVEAILVLEGKEVARKDVTDKSLINAKDVERYRIMEASGETNAADDSGKNLEFGKMKMDGEGVERGYYFADFTPEEAGGKVMEDGSSPAYDFDVEVTYVSGETYKLRK